MAGSQFKQALDEYRADNETQMQKMAFDVFQNVTADGIKVEVFIEKRIKVETGVTPLQIIMVVVNMIYSMLLAILWVKP